MSDSRSSKRLIQQRDLALKPFTQNEVQANDGTMYKAVALPAIVSSEAELANISPLTFSLVFMVRDLGLQLYIFNGEADEATVGIELAETIQNLYLPEDIRRSGKWIEVFLGNQHFSFAGNILTISTGESDG